MKTHLAILADYAQEGWPSMDLAAQMLHAELRKRHADRIDTELVCPKFRRLAGFWHNANRLINRHWTYPRFVRKISGKFSAFHICDHSYAHLVHALPARHTGVFCHDLDAFACLIDPGAHPRPEWFKNMARWTLTGMQKAAVVFYTTQFVRGQIVQHGLLDEAKLVQTPLGAAAEFSPGPRKHGEHFLLHVGSCIPRKRIDVLLDVAAAVCRTRPQLRLIQVGGQWTHEQRQRIDRLGIKSLISQKSGISRAELADFYRSAAVVMVTSQSEGFGLPMIEALACAAPVVASDLAVLREVGGDAATYCPVGDVADWVKCVGNLFDKGDDPHSRQARINQAAQFTWSEHARIIADVYAGMVH